MLHYDGATGLLRATVTDEAGAAVTDATVTVTIADATGTPVITAQSMPHDSGGVYEYTVADDALSVGRYDATVTITSGSNVRTPKERIIVREDRP